MKPTITYVPGVCNIGPEEIARRRAFGWAGLIVTVVLVAALVLARAHPLLRLFAFIPATGGAFGFLQAHFGFCVAYAGRGVSGMEGVGNTSAIADLDSRARDRRKGRKIAILAILAGVLVAAACYTLPI